MEPTLPRAAQVKKPKDTPERILKAALAAFSQKGFEGARSRDIAAQAKVTLGVVQYHFGTKDELWKAAVERAFGQLEAGLDTVLANPAKREDLDLLRDVVRGHVRFVAENTEFIRIMHDEGKSPGARMRWLTDRYVRPLFDKVTPLIESAQKNGALIADVAPAHLVYALLGAGGMFFHQAEECKRLTGIDPSSNAAIDAHCRVVESLFFGFNTGPNSGLHSGPNSAPNHPNQENTQ
jgi:TetR/AcrR family transcriptional regulator